MEIVLIVIIAIIVIAVKAHFNSPDVKGRRGEDQLERKLDTQGIWGREGKTLRNIYVPRVGGDTTEIDLLYITTKGLFVLESKNYAGYIFGSESSRNWTVTLYAGKTWYGGKKVEKHQFYNPVWQNRTHIKHLTEYLKSEALFSNIPTFSVIAFSDRGSLKDVTVNSDNVYVCYKSGLSRTIRDIWENSPDALSQENVERIYNKLLPLTNKDAAEKQQHVQAISNRYSSTETCPWCGGKLVLRTAKKGNNAGNQFYGCANYPKCRYTKKID